uniref:Uncharacterized protein n=1 Tax=Timema shepardi TaxID=629360 RepID=A0A7R9AV20_TIMSH|nr:unnamed protein product [Timema shepardi]
MYGYFDRVFEHLGQELITVLQWVLALIQSYNSIRDVKQKVFDALHIPIEHQKLLLIGKPLAGSSSPSWLCPLSVADYLGTNIPMPEVYLSSLDSKENIPTLARLPSAGHTRQGAKRLPRNCSYLTSFY